MSYLPVALSLASFEKYCYNYRCAQKCMSLNDALHFKLKYNAFLVVKDKYRYTMFTNLCFHLFVVNGTATVS